MCGHSLEVNATSDLDVFVSLNQITLAERVMNTNMAAINNLVLSLTPATEEYVSETLSSLKQKVSVSNIDQI